jgi:hypothetical protein
MHSFRLHEGIDSDKFTPKQLHLFGVAAYCPLPVLFHQHLHASAPSITPISSAHTPPARLPAFYGYHDERQRRCGIKRMVLKMRRAEDAWHAALRATAATNPIANELRLGGRVAGRPPLARAAHGAAPRRRETTPLSRRSIHPGP